MYPSPASLASIDLFVNKIACEGNTLMMKCPEDGQAIAIYSAFFGSKSTPVPECPPRGPPYTQHPHHQAILVASPPPSSSSSRSVASDASSVDEVTKRSKRSTSTGLTSGERAASIDADDHLGYKTRASNYEDKKDPLITLASGQKTVHEKEQMVQLDESKTLAHPLGHSSDSFIQRQEMRSDATQIHAQSKLPNFDLPFSFDTTGLIHNR